MFDQKYLSDQQLRERVIELVHHARQQLPERPTHADIEGVFGLQIREHKFPLQKDGAYLADERKIVLNSLVASPERRQFTLYHELMHHLLREDDELYGYLHEAYEDSEIFDQTIEFICNMGSAEFILPREFVRSMVEAEGFSLKLLPKLCENGFVSGPAALIQLIQNAPHRCFGVVCEFGLSPVKLAPNQASFVKSGSSEHLYILYATWSQAEKKYKLARWTVIPQGHLLSKVYESQGFAESEDIIPFQSGNVWSVPCQILFFRGKVYGIFNITPPVSPLQLHLF